MSEYQEFVSKVSDRLHDGLDRVQQSQLDLLKSIQERAGRFAPTLPARIADRLPDPKAVVRANFGLAERLLKSQRSFALSVLEALESKPAKAAKKTPKAA